MPSKSWKQRRKWEGVKNTLKNKGKELTYSKRQKTIDARKLGETQTRGTQKIQIYSTGQYH